MLKIKHHTRQALYGVAATRDIEQAALALLAPHTLMQRAGLAVAQLALALAPHAQRIWLACGSGNNGGDGLEAALHLQRWGKYPLVTWLGHADSTPQDAAASYRRAQDAGVTFLATPPADADFCIDALLGLSANPRAPMGQMAEWIQQINQSRAPCLAVDLPTGLNADTGLGTPTGIQASHTLSLLTLKPGLFTADGRDAAGTVWLADLTNPGDPGHDRVPLEPTAWLAGAPSNAPRRHASHKGSYGDVAIVGGAPGMTGAALLAASAALHAGAGRVFIGLLDAGALGVDISQPELMFRPIDTLDLNHMTLVCGCGGGDAIAALLPRLLNSNAPRVLDADALNALALDPVLQTLVRARAKSAADTVLTPHPLEAARLLGSSTGQVQQNRLAAARQLSQQFNCTVALKGAGTVIATPGRPPVINPTGNARLATAGTGDVLAGMIGAGLARGMNAFEATCEAVYHHGLLAQKDPLDTPLVASKLARQSR
ncbi:MAG: hydroxyethylthiazole kinase-like uncharacterized protein yjeF [Rhodoferax sp.]|jgi:hydroxyethylthiazole kinase-like uncharacterized protein yjeF